MRFILVAAVLVAGLHIGTNAIKKVDQIQQQKLDRLCKIDYSFCTPESK